MRSTWILVDVILQVISPSLPLNWISIQKAKKKSLTHWRFKSFVRWIKSLLAITVKKKLKKLKKNKKNPKLHALLHNKYPGSKSFDTSVKFSLKRNSRSFYNYPYLSLIFTNTNLSTLLNFFFDQIYCYSLCPQPLLKLISPFICDEWNILLVLVDHEYVEPNSIWWVPICVCNKKSQCLLIVGIH